MPKCSSNSQTSTLRTSDGTVVRCLYVTNIPVNTQSHSVMQGIEKELMTMLKSFGDIKQFYLKKNEQTKKTTYAFVTFATPEEAYRMYSARNQLRYRGRKLYVSTADSWHQPTVQANGTVNYNPQWKSDNYRKQIGRFVTRYKRDQSSKDSEGDDEASDGDEEEEEDEEEKVEEVVVKNEDTQECPVLKLNDDCFLLILEYIPFKQRHVLSHVCHRWRSLMKLYWARLTDLNFYKKPFSEVEFSEKRFDLYLRLCPNITTVLLANRSNAMKGGAEQPTSQSIVRAATLCPRLRELSLSSIELKGRPLAAVAHCCKFLRSITVNNCKFDERDNELNAIIRKCLKLERVKITNCNLKPGHWLRNLRSGLKCLSLLCCEMNTSSFLVGLNNVKSNLEELELVVDMPSDPLDFKKLHEFPLLQRLIYVNRTNQKQKVNTDIFKDLKNLELEFCAFLTDDIVKGIVTHSPNLTVLNIASSKDTTVSIDGYKAVAGLKDLLKLNLSMTTITDEVLLVIAENCTKLEILSANLCQSITDTGCISVVTKLMKLRELHIDSCIKVTNKTAEAAIEAATQNPQKARLNIFAAGCWSMFKFSEGSNEMNMVIHEAEMHPHPLVDLTLDSRGDLNWLLCNSLQDFADFFHDDSNSECDEDDDDEDYDFDVYDEHDIYNYPYDSEEDFDFELGDLDDLNPFSFYLDMC